MTPLRQRMIEDMELRHLSPRTTEACVMRVAGFARYSAGLLPPFGREEVHAYLFALTAATTSAASAFFSRKSASMRRSASGRKASASRQAFRRWAGGRRVPDPDCAVAGNGHKTKAVGAESE